MLYLRYDFSRNLIVDDDRNDRDWKLELNKAVGGWVVRRGRDRKTAE